MFFFSVPFLFFFLFFILIFNAFLLYVEGNNKLLLLFEALLMLNRSDGSGHKPLILTNFYSTTHKKPIDGIGKLKTEFLALKFFCFPMSLIGFERFLMRLNML